MSVVLYASIFIFVYLYLYTMCSFDQIKKPQTPILCSVERLNVTFHVYIFAMQETPPYRKGAEASPAFMPLASAPQRCRLIKKRCIEEKLRERVPQKGTPRAVPPVPIRSLSVWTPLSMTTFIAMLYGTHSTERFLRNRKDLHGRKAADFLRLTFPDKERSVADSSRWCCEFLFYFCECRAHRRRQFHWLAWLNLKRINVGVW